MIGQPNRLTEITTLYILIWENVQIYISHAALELTHGEKLTTFGIVPNHGQKVSSKNLN